MLSLLSSGHIAAQKWSMHSNSGWLHRHISCMRCRLSAQEPQTSVLCNTLHILKVPYYAKFAFQVFLTQCCVSVRSMNSPERRKGRPLFLLLAPLFKMCMLEHSVLSVLGISPLWCHRGPCNLTDSTPRVSVNTTSQQFIFRLRPPRTCGR